MSEILVPIGLQDFKYQKLYLPKSCFILLVVYKI